MHVYVDFGRYVTIQDSASISETASVKRCRTVVEARELRARFGGTLYRMIDGERVEVA